MHPGDVRSTKPASVTGQVRDAGKTGHLHGSKTPIHKTSRAAGAEGTVESLPQHQTVPEDFSAQLAELPVANDTT